MSTGCSPPGFRGHCQPTSRCFGGGRAGWVLSVVNAHCLGAAVAKSSMTVCKMGVVGKGGTCCFMCVVGVVVCGGCAFRGVASVYNLILARACTFLMVRDSEVASSKDSKRSLRERPMWLVFRDGTELVGFVWFGFSHAVAWRAYTVPMLPFL